MKHDELLNVHQVAAVLKMSRAYVYRLIRHGKLPALHFGKSVRVRREDLIRYLHEKAPPGMARELLKILEE